MPRIKVDLGEDTHGFGIYCEEDGYFRVKCGRCGINVSWYIGDPWEEGDDPTPTSHERLIHNNDWYLTEVDHKVGRFIFGPYSVIRCDKCGPVEQDEDGSVYECTKEEVQRREAEKKKNRWRTRGDF